MELCWFKSQSSMVVGLVMHSKTRQVVAMQVGLRSKETAEKLFYKLPDSLKKSPVLY